MNPFAISAAIGIGGAFIGGCVVLVVRPRRAPTDSVSPSVAAAELARRTEKAKRKAKVRMLVLETAREMRRQQGLPKSEALEK